MKRTLLYLCRAAASSSNDFSGHLPAPAPAFNGLPSLSYAREVCSLLQTISQSPRSHLLLPSLDSMLAGAPPLDSSASLVVLRALSRHRKLTRAKSILSDLSRRQRFVPDLFLYSVLLHCVLPQSPIHDVQLLWSEACPDRGPIAVSDLIVHLCSHGGLAAGELEHLFRCTLSGRHPISQQAYTAIIDSAASAGDGVFAGEVLREMEVNGVDTDRELYSAVFQSFCRIGDVAGADSSLRIMLERGYSGLDYSLYSNFLIALCRSSKWREAHKLFVKMLKRNRNTLSSVSPNPPRPMRRVIFQLNLEPSAAISDAEISEAYLYSLCIADNMEEAEKLLDEVSCKNIILRNSSYGSYIEALFRARRVEDAVEFYELERRKRRGFSMEVGRTVVAGLCSMGRVEDGYKLLQEMTRDGSVQPLECWRCVIESFWRIGRSEEAIDIFDEMKRQAVCQDCVQLDAVMFEVMAQGFLEKGDPLHAILLLEEMKTKNWIPSAALYGAVCRSLRAIGKTEEAYGYVNEMIENGALVSYTNWQVLFDSVITKPTGLS